MYSLERRLWPDGVPAGQCLLPVTRFGTALQRPMSQKHFLRRLRELAQLAGMAEDDVARLEQRSLRAGGCTDAFAGGMLRAAIMRQGGWSSEAVDIYNRPTTSQRWQSFALFWRGCR